VEPTEVLADLQLQLVPAAAEAVGQTSELEIVYPAEYAPPTPIDQQRREGFCTRDIHDLLQEDAWQLCSLCSENDLQKCGLIVSLSNFEVATMSHLRSLQATEIMQASSESSIANHWVNSSVQLLHACWRSASTQLGLSSIKQMLTAEGLTANHLTLFDLQGLHSAAWPLLSHHVYELVSNAVSFQCGDIPRCLVLSA